MTSVARQLNRLTALEVAALVEAGEASAEAVTRACLRRIEERNHEVGAFVAWDAGQALAEARRADALPRGPILRGVPFAAKDVFETADYPTAFGSPIHAGNRPAADAGCVAVARRNGAVLLGKVATGEFATQTPSETRNPLRLAHTPGGSSGGSAAAVADFMVPFAFGTQTTGSIIRPATYCGIVGYKPSLDLLPRAGMKALSPSQDTAGLIARTVSDIAFLLYGLHGDRNLPAAMPAPRIGICRSAQWAHAQPATVAEIERFARRLEAAGATVSSLTLDPALEALVDVQSEIVAYEARLSLAHEYRVHADRLSERLRQRLAGSEATDFTRYRELLRRAAVGRRGVAALFDAVDVLLYPAAEGEAEPGIGYSGSPRFGALWTLLHLPSIAFPIGHGPGGLPVGAQLIGPYLQDRGLLAAAEFAVRAADYR